MHRLKCAFLVATVLSFGALPAFADTSAGSMGSPGDAARAAGTKTLSAERAGSPRALKRSGESTGRSTNPADAVKAYTVIGRSKNGQERRIEPSDAVRRVLSGEKRADVEEAAPEGAADPLFEGQERAIVGRDNRVQLNDTTDYPFSAVGYLYAENTASGTVYGCSASLIGARTIVTAASCIYNHNLEDPWFDDIGFYPGVNGDDLPFGGFDWLNAYVFNGFVTEYDGTYDSIWMYDIAVIELDSDIGEYTGWFDYRFTRLGSFEGHMVGYHSDKPVGTQWRSTCNVNKKDIFDMDFNHSCDSGGDEAWGAPIYLYNGQDKPRRMVGINMGDYGNANWALRVDEAVYSWLVELAQ